MCTKGLQNGGKREVRAAPESAPARRSCKKGCNVQSVHYLLCFKHIGPPRKGHFFSPVGTPKWGKNRVYARGRQKTSQKRGNGRRRDAKGGHMGAQGWPRVSKMTPQILPKFIDKRGPGPGAHPKGAKGTPGPPKSQKSKEF